MGRYHIFKFGLAIIFYAVYCHHPMTVDALKQDTKTKNNNKTFEDDYVYYQGVQGKPGVDFPVLTHIPRTSFTCKNVESGYYADLDTDCQVFHICEDGKKISFLCPNGTIFQQGELICEWWFKVNCTNSPSLYEESAEQLREEKARKKLGRKVTNREKSTDLVHQESAGQLREKKTRLKFGRHSTEESHTGSVVYQEQLQEETKQGRKAADRSTKQGQTGAETFNQRASKRVFQKEPFLNDVDSGQKRRKSHSERRRKPSFFEDFASQEEKTGDEAQITQETASFYQNTYNRIDEKVSTPDPYPNHRNTYSELKEPQYYSTKIFSAISSVTPQYLTTQMLNNGRPFLGSQVGLSFTPLPSSTARYLTTPAPGSFNLGQSATKTSTSTTTPDTTDTKIPAAGTQPTIFVTQSTVFVTPSTSRSVSSPDPIVTESSVLDKKLTTSVIQSTGFVSPSTTSPLVDTIPTSDTNPTNFVSHGVTSSTTTASTTQKSLTTSKVTDFATVYGRFSKASTIPTKRTILLTKSLYGPSVGSSEILSVADSKNGLVPQVRFFGSVGSKPVRKSTNLVIASTLKPSTERQPKSTGFFSTTAQTVIKPRPFQLSVDQDISRPVYSTESSVRPTFPTYRISSASPFALASTAVPFENVDSMINALAEMATQNDYANEGPRPGLVIPPSAGPQTLHTLAVYFANALDGIAAEPEADTTASLTPHELEKKRLTELLTKMTMERYNELFVEDAQKDTLAVSDLEGQDSSNFPPTPKVRQLAKVFTQALSSYLDDPETFKRVLLEIRPTEPPPLAGEELPDLGDDELLNFSDADIKSSYAPFVSTPKPPRPTWGYLLAYNQSQNVDVKNSLNSDLENLQGADSQSFVSQLNKLHQGRYGSKTTEAPERRSTIWPFGFDPATINENFATSTSLPPLTTTGVPAGDVREIKYELRALPQLELNSSQVHGILIDFMNTTKSEEDNRLQRILRKLNTTEEEFLSRMKEIESNPLTRRLVLLLISECGNSARKDIEAVPVESLLGQGFSQKVSPLQALVDPRLEEDNQDARALQLLNSLYTIASKFGRK